MNRTLFAVMMGAMLAGCVNYAGRYIPVDPQCETKPAAETAEYISGDEATLKDLEQKGFVVIGEARIKDVSLDAAALLQLAGEVHAAKVVVLTKTISSGFTNDQNARLQNNLAYGGLGYTPETANMQQMDPVNLYTVYFLQERK